MSYDALDWSMPKIIPDVNVKSCLNVLAFHHNNETGLCCPSISTIEEEMGVKSLNTVRKSLKSLEAMGLIKAFQVCKESGKVIRTEYELNLSSKAFVQVKTTTRKVHVLNDDGSCGEVSLNEASQDESYGAHIEPSMVHDVKHMVHVVNPNKEYNKEEEQGNNTDVHSAVFHADVSDLDLFDELPPVNDSDIIPTQVEIVSEQKRTRKPSDQRKRSSPREGTRIDPNLELPDEWREICERLDPDLDPNLVFDNFKNYWLGVSGKGALKADWKATWRNCVSSYRNAPDWKRNPMLKKNFVRKDPNVVQAKVVTHELTQEQRKKIGYGICYD